MRWQKEILLRNIQTHKTVVGEIMKQKLSSWWEQESSTAYVAKRALVCAQSNKQFAPFTHFIVYYCGANFTPQRVAQSRAELTYLINGEKDVPNVQEESPWMYQAEKLIDVLGGAIRPEEVEIIPVLYVAMGFEGQTGRWEFSSDQVPQSENADRTVRVVCGQFENVAHSVPVPPGVTVLDVVLNQGGKFSWQLPANCRAGVYVVSGAVQIGSDVSLKNCRADTLVWAQGKRINITAQCAGGRLLIFTVPAEKATEQEVYVQEILPELEQVEK